MTSGNHDQAVVDRGATKPANGETPTSGLTVDALSSWYGAARALWDVSIAVADGELVGLVGRNGAGKSTLLRSISRLHEKTTGSIDLDGTSLDGLSAAEASKVGVSIVRESGAVLETFTVAEHLQLASRLAELRDLTPPSLDEVIEWFPDLADRLSTRGGLLSGGQRQMLALASALSTRPRLLLLDEPSAGLAEVVTETVFDRILALVGSGDGPCVVIAEQDARWLDGIASRVYVLDGGRVKYETTPEDIDDDDVDFHA